MPDTTTVHVLGATTAVGRHEAHTCAAVSVPLATLHVVCVTLGVPGTPATNEPPQKEAGPTTNRCDWRPAPM